MENELIEKVIKRVEKEMSSANAASSACAASTASVAPPWLRMQDIGVAEYVGTTIGGTIGLVIASLDTKLVETLGVGKYRSIGIIGSRTGLAPQCMAVDDAVKATNTEVISIEQIRDDTSGGQGTMIMLGADDVSDVRRAIEITLASVEKYFGDVYTNDAGHLEFQYTARASYCLAKAFGCELGKAFGLVCGAPAAIGIVLSDVAVKAASVDLVSYTSPAGGEGFSYQNEVTLTFTGDSGAVRQAVKASIDVGIKLLGAMDKEPVSCTTPYI
jgi:microcompartment protein PduB